MKLHLPCALRKSLIAALVAVSFSVHTAQAVNNEIKNHGAVPEGTGMTDKTSGSAYGWADGLDFTTDSTVCYLGVSGNLSSFDKNIFSLPGLPMPPGDLIEQTPTSLAAYITKLQDYAKDTGSEVGQLIDFVQFVSDLKEGNATDSMFGTPFYMEYDSGKTYINITSERYDADVAGSKFESGDPYSYFAYPSGPNVSLGDTAFSRGEQNTAASGYIRIDEAFVQFSNSCTADAGLTITNKGNLSGAVNGNAAGSRVDAQSISVTGGSKLCADTVHAEQDITVTGGSHLAATQISNGNKLLTVTGSSLSAAKNNLTVGVHLAADDSDISADGQLHLLDLSGSKNTVTGGNMIDIQTAIVGDNNTFDVNRQGGDIHVGKIDGVSVTGDNNTFGTGAVTPEDVALDGSVNGNGNKFMATDTIATGSIVGNDNDLTVTKGLNNVNAPVITVNGGILGDKNNLLSSAAGSLLIYGDVSNAGADTGIGNSIIAQGDGSIDIRGSLAGTNEAVKTLQTGSIRLGSLGDNTGLQILVNDGTFSTTGASNATVSSNSTLKASGDIVFGSGLAQPDADSTLTFASGSKVTTTDGSITANQNLSVTGTGSSLLAEKGTTTVHGILNAADNAVVRTNGLTANALIISSGATVTSNTAELNGGILSVTDATLNANVSGVETGELTGNPGHQALVNGTIEGTGSGTSSLTITGSVTTGSPEKDGSISNFDYIMLGNTPNAETNVTVNGDVITTETGNIDIYNSNLITVTGEMTSGTGFFITESTLKVGADQIALDGDIDIANYSTVLVEGNQSASYGNTDTEANIDVLDSQLTVNGNQTAQTDIGIGLATVSIGGDQTATEGSIDITNSNELDAFAGNVEDENYAVVIGGTQTAGTWIDIYDSTLKVGADQIVLDGYINILGGSTVLVGNDQSASYGDAAPEASIAVDHSQLTVNGNQTAQSNVGIVNSTVSIGGSQTATEGFINIVHSNENDAFAGNVDGENYAVVIGGTQTAGTGININNSTLKVGADQIVLDGDINILNGSTVLVGNDQSASYGDAAPEADIFTLDSQLTVNGNQTAQSDVGIGNSTVRIGGSQTATEGSITIEGSNGDGAFAGNVDGENYAVVIGGTQTAGTGIYIGDSTLKVGADQIALDGDIDILDHSSVLVEGNQSAAAAMEGYSASILVDHADLTVKGDQTAANAVMIGDHSTVRVEGDVTAQGLYPNTNLAILINGASEVNVLGNMTVAEEGNIQMTEGSQVTIGGQLTAEGGSLAIIGTGTVVKINKDNAQPFDTVIGSGIASIAVDAGNTLETGNVAVDATNLLVNGTLTATAWETAAGTTLIDGTGTNEGRVTITEGDLLLGGQNGLTEATASATLGDIELAGHNVVRNSSLTAEAGDIRIATDSTLAEGIENAGTLIQDSHVEAAGVISIEGETGNLALVTGNTGVLAHGSDLFGLSTGQNLETGILLSNVALSGLTGYDDVKAMEGSIVLADVVSMENATLFTNSSDLVPDGDAAGTVMLDGDATLLMKANSALESTLSSADKTALIIKTGSDVLQLDYSARNYNGSIDVTSGDGSEFTINCDGLGNDAVTRLKDTNLLVTEDAFTAAADRVVTLGTIDTRYDEGNRNTALGNLDRVLINGSYTRDDGKRASYQNIGTVIALNEGHSGDRAEANSLYLNGNTLVKIETVLNADGTVAHDSIGLSGTLDAGGARIFGTLLHGSANEAAVADGTRVQIVSPGGQAAVASGFHEDMLYDIAKSASGTYQRVLTTLNGHVETTADGVYLVYSRNYLGADKNANQSQLAHVLGKLSQRVDHTEGTLAASSSQLDRLLDAFDYTRSEGDALRGLDSVSGVTNTIAQHAMMDATRHHLNTLRTHIGTPECPAVNDGKRLQTNRNSSVWFAYEGGYDSIGGDGSMGDYTRTSQGGLVGYEYTFDCNFLLGIDMGYENAIARSDATKLTADTYFADIYASVKTGIVNHKISVGTGIYDFDSRRGIHVAAASHTFSETALGATVGRSINAGYEASADFEVGRRSWVTPFLTVNFGYHTINKLKEDNLGAASMTTEFDDVTQLDAGLGARYAHQFSCVSKQAPATVFASLAVKAEFSDRRPEASSWFAADPSLGFRVHSIEREPLYLQVGAGLTVPFARNWSATAAGSGEFGKDRASVNGSVGVRYSF